MDDLKHTHQETPSRPAMVHSRGQTLAEFAISLPILLLLLFGVIEFGRLFQSWVTVQNAARVAARFAITGKTGEYDPDTYLNCVRDDPATMTWTDFAAPVYTPPGYTLDEFLANPFYSPGSYNNGQVYRTVKVVETTTPLNESEHLYRTWYGTNCDPSSQVDDQRMKDLVRLMAIYDTARKGAAGLTLDEALTNPLDGETPSDVLWRFMQNTWSNPHPGSERSRFFNVVVCSTRERYYGADRSEIANNPDDEQPNAQALLRYYTADDDPNWVTGACILKERTLTGSDVDLYNYNIPWQDAGAPGERVTIMVTYNHPLVTPLRLGSFVRIQARRSAVNEAFRITDTNLALSSGSSNPPPPPTVITNTPVTPSATPTVVTNTPSNTPTEVPTGTPIPFTCANLIISTVETVGSRMRTSVRNLNEIDTYMTRAFIAWDSGRMTTEYPGTQLAYMALNSQVTWEGNDIQSITDTLTEGSSYMLRPGESAPSGVANPGDYNVFYLYADPLAQTLPNDFEVLFVGGPTDLQGAGYEGWTFQGTRLYFYNPSTNTDCELILPTPPAPTPTPTFPPDFTPSATFTPNCASNLMRVEFVSWDQGGDLRLRVVNNRTVVAPFTGFQLFWPAYKVPSLQFVKMVVGGNDANDTQASGGTGVVVWNAAGFGHRPSPATNYAESFTLSTDTLAGTWNNNGNIYNVAYTFPPNSTTLLHLDFTGVGLSRLNQVGVSGMDFNGSRFFIGCGRPTSSGGGGGGGSGGGGGGTGIGAGEIILSELPTPAPTATIAPTRTPGPTPIPTTPPPTKVPTTPPPTLPPTTPPPTVPPPTATLVPPPTIGGGGSNCGSGSC